ncbi:hypothetical protein F5879DRAFT_1043683 [Lentinula edodes]|nr:hypothetical protein F5879DRAFT_1043683 [Lentinula edodes]
MPLSLIQRFVPAICTLKRLNIFFVSTLAFVSPGDVLPKILEQLRQDINLDVLSSLTEDEFGIWATPEGTAFVDVISFTKDDVRDKKGKDSEINKWEDELRKSLADKKAKAAKTSTLTK